MNQQSMSVGLEHDILITNPSNPSSVAVLSFNGSVKGQVQASIELAGETEKFAITKTHAQQVDLSGIGKLEVSLTKMSNDTFNVELNLQEDMQATACQEQPAPAKQSLQMKPSMAA